MNNTKITTNARAIIIIVDDLGLSTAVNDAVISLAERGRVGASSYMAGGHISDADSHKLTALNVDIGLHLDLTGVFPSELRGSLKSLIIASYLRKINGKQVSNIIKQQFDAFEETFNRAPVFIDGHQHIHQFPVIREQLISEMNARYGSADSRMSISARVTTPLINDFKSWIIYTLGGRAWRELCKANHMATNDRFGGVYGFDASAKELAILWGQWLQSAPRSQHLSAALYTQSLEIERLGTYAQYGSTTPPIHSVPLSLPANMSTTLIMCHPAVADTSWQDEIKGAREREYEWLMSHQFEDLLQQNEVRLVRWSDIMTTH